MAYKSMLNSIKIKTIALRRIMTFGFFEEILFKVCTMGKLSHLTRTLLPARSLWKSLMWRKIGNSSRN